MTDIETPRLTIRGLTKSFGTSKVLDGIDLRIGPGEFVGLMGPNGAGKSTLIKILDGIYTATSGEIRLGDQVVRSLSGRSEVGFIHQDLGLVDALSIADNLRLGERPMRLVGPILDRRKEGEAGRRALERVALNRPVETLVGALSPGEKTLVAIARAFDRGARILVVDEATSTLPPADAKRVMSALARTAEEGATVIIVTHKLSEIIDSTNRVVVLLDGRIVADHPTASLDHAGLVRLLVTHDAASEVAAAGGANPGRELIAMRDAHAGPAGPITFDVRAGEVVGITGLPGSGLHDVAFLAHGTIAPTAGTVSRADAVVSALVPPHRETQGGFPALSVCKNMSVRALPRWRSALRLLSIRREEQDCSQMAERLKLKPARVSGPFGVLSGGNKQKVIFARALLARPDVYVLCEPTRGVDVGTRAEIYSLIRELRVQGAGVLIATSDDQDLFAVCDRVGVIVDGRITELRDTASMDISELEALV